MMVCIGYIIIHCVLVCIVVPGIIYPTIIVHVGIVAGVYVTYSGRERIRALIRDQFSRFTPPVDEQFYM